MNYVLVAATSMVLSHGFQTDASNCTVILWKSLLVYENINDCVVFYSCFLVNYYTAAPRCIFPKPSLNSLFNLWPKDLIKAGSGFCSGGTESPH